MSCETRRARAAACEGRRGAYSVVVGDFEKACGSEASLLCFI